MANRSDVPAPLRGTIFRGSDAIAAGLLTPRRLAGAAWQRIFRDVYAEATVEVDHAVRCWALIRLLLPSAMLTGVSAAALYGVADVPATEPVEVIVPVPHGPIRGVRLHHGPVPADERRVLSGLAAVTPARACWDIVRSRGPVEAMSYLDGFLRHGLVTPGDLEKYAWANGGRPGWRRFLAAVGQADGAAESPQESRTRIILVRSGLPRPVSQFPIVDRGRIVARADLAWPEYRVAVEYDGFAYHSDRADLARDRARLNRQQVAGWIVVHVSADLVRGGYAAVIADVRAALHSRGWRP